MKDKKTLMTAAVVLFAAFASARAETWDFTGGGPADLKPGKGARFIAGGLTAVNPDDSNLAAGCRMKKAFRLPEAFELTAEFTPSAALPPGKSRVGHVWDDMYVNYAPKWRHAGLQLILQHRGDKWQPIAYFGRGDMTEVVSGPAVALQPGRSTKLVLLYDANRRVRLELAGVSLEGALTRAGAITCGFYGTTFGDRFGSSYHPLDVTLSRVSVKALPRESFTILPVSTRLAFVRGEANARIRLTAENFSDGTLSQVRGEMRELTAAGVCVKTASESLADLAAGAVCEFTFPVETRVRPGALQFEITLSAVSADGPLKVRRSLAGAIGPAFLADRMPVLMWGFAAPTSVLADLGFTHGLLYGLGFTAPPRPGADLGVPIRTLDDALANGIRLAKSIGVEFPTNRPESAYYVLARDGTPRMSSSIRNQNVPEVANPDFAATAAKTARANCEVFGDHPAFCGVLPCSERRDHSYPSFNMQDDLYRRATGRETPPEVDRRRVANKKDTLKRFPDGVIDEKDPVYQYYRWFWKGGDGWPGYVSAIADAYRAGVGDRKDFFSFWDPAVRCPPLWGSGGSVDIINQWIYAVPEPMNVAAAAEEMFAMNAGARPGQDVMIMTQLICYRSQIAPSNTVVNPAPAWLAKRPLAGFPSIPPDSLTEAVWSMISKPVKGIMFHGWGTIYETGSETGYCFTNPETTKRLRHLLRDVVAPLGPTLRRLGRADSQFAVFESATTCLMGGPATWGWSSPSITFCQRARLDPRVVYEETIERDGFGGAKVLYAPQCMFLTQPMIERIRAFQAAGGILVGDDEMLSALKPDLKVPVISFRPPDEDGSAAVDELEARKTGDVKTREGTMRMKANMQRDGEALRKALAARGFLPTVDSSTPEIITYSRRFGATPYVFAVNDHRTFGDYVGQWGKTMEKGLPQRGEVTLAGAGSTVAVYELSRGGKVTFRRDAEGRVSVPLEFATNDGRILMFLTEPIARLDLSVSKGVERGGRIRLRLSVLGASGRPVPAVLPVDVRVTDARGRELDGAGYAAAVNGVCELSLQTNLDDPTGDYAVVCRDRASGLVARAVIQRQNRRLKTSLSPDRQ